MEVVDLLLNSGAEVDKVDKDGETPLMLAAREGEVHVTRRLLQEGAKVDAEDVFNRTALTYAIANKKSDVAVVLIHAG